MKEASKTWVSRLSPGQTAALACALEVAAPKPGNVHRGADFADASLADFLISGQILGACIDQGANDRVGQVIQSAVSATRQAVGTNTNLGMALLICPLARCAQTFGRIDPTAIGEVLRSLDASDAQAVYQAIRIAAAGGMGQVERWDVNAAAPTQLLDAMREAEDRDWIAYQYTHDFHSILDDLLPGLIDSMCRFRTLARAIVYTHVRWIAEHGDSLIRRKCGDEVHEQARIRAQKVRDRWNEGSDPDRLESELAEFDFWLRSDGNRRNPGTTADLIAAALFVGLSQGQLTSCG